MGIASIGEMVPKNRRSLRLQGFDYSSNGAYFVTICTQNRECLFGKIIDEKMVLNDAGQQAKSCWIDMPNHFPNVELDSFVIMPNHVHGIIIVGAQFIAPKNGHSFTGSGVMNHAPTLGMIVRAFKAKSSHGIHRLGLCKKSWQRNYYEHIIRNEPDLNRIREYIVNNPLKWDEDENNPMIFPACTGK